MLEKVKYGTSEFEIVPNGLEVREETLIIRHVMNGKTVDNIENIIRNVDNTQRIEILDRTGSLMMVLDGYVMFGGIQKIPDYVVQVVSVQDPVEEGKDPTYHEETDIRDIIIVTLKKVDIREELRRIAEIQDTMLLTMLGFGEV